MVDEIRAFRPEADYRFSLANSAGLLSVKDSLFTDARPGIIQYGIMPSLDVPNRLGLKPVLSFHSEVVHVQHIPAGEGIGYGSTYITAEPMTIATIPVGYADGYLRAYAPGEVIVSGVRCPIVGRVCMDQCMIRLPYEMPVRTKVTLLGKEGNECITAEELSHRSHTISYESLCLISDRVPRIYKS